MRTFDSISINVVSGRLLSFIALFLLISTQPILAGSNWPQYQYNAQHTGYNDVDKITPPLTLLWSKNYDLSRWIPPVAVANGKAILSLYNRNHGKANFPTIMCLDAKTGEELWSQDFQSGLWTLSQASYADGIVVVNCMDEWPYLAGFDLETGEWLYMSRYWATSRYSKAPTIYDGKSYTQVGSQGGIGCFDHISGEPLWSNPRLSDISYWTPALFDGTAYSSFICNFGGFDAMSGTRLWYLEFCDNQWLCDHPYASGYSPVIDTVNNILFGPTYCKLYALDLATQELLWEKDGLYNHLIEDAYRDRVNPALYDGKVFTLDSGRLKVYDAVTGNLEWLMWDDQTLFTHDPVIANGYVFLSNDSVVKALDWSTKQIVWSDSVGGFLSVGNNTLFVAARYSWVYAFGGLPVAVEEDDKSELPDIYTLEQNHPNPFNPSTTIEFTLPRGLHVLLRIYDVLGREVTTLVDKQLTVGKHSITWNGTNFTGEPVATGTYFYRLTTDGYSESKKMTLLK